MRKAAPAGVAEAASSRAGLEMLPALRRAQAASLGPGADAEAGTNGPIDPARSVTAGIAPAPRGEKQSPAPPEYVTNYYETGVDYVKISYR